jgi:hypothetical protein
MQSMGLSEFVQSWEKVYGEQDVTARDLVVLAQEHLDLVRTDPPGMGKVNARHVGIFLVSLLGKPVDPFAVPMKIVIRTRRPGRLALYRLENYVQRSAEELREYFANRQA